MTQERRNADALLQGLRLTEYMVNTLAESAKQYWSWWGPLGEPMKYGIDVWADAQHGYLQYLRRALGVQSPSSIISPTENGVFESRTKEALRAARQSARETQRIAREAERHAKEIQEED